jgi:hypothetical protein
MSEIFEIVMFKRLEQHLESNNILATEQFGFRKGAHIENAIFTNTDNILIALNKRQQVGGIFCNITKAFDCVNHTILLNKLQYITMESEGNVITGLNLTLKTEGKYIATHSRK